VSESNLPPVQSSRSLQTPRNLPISYYGWYSNKMRGRRAKQADEKARV
jgi:hypothetical protein